MKEVVIDLELLTISLSEEITDQAQPKNPAQIDLKPTFFSETPSEDDEPFEIVEQDIEYLKETWSDDEIGDLDSCLLDFTFEGSNEPSHEDKSAITAAIWARFNGQPPSVYHEGPQYTTELLEHVYADMLERESTSGYRDLFLPRHARSYAGDEAVPTWPKPLGKERRAASVKVSSNLRNVWTYGDSI